MTEKSKSQIVEEINSTLSQMDEIYVKIREQCSSLASLRRREEKINQHYTSSDSKLPSNDSSNYFVDLDLLESVNVSFALSTAEAAERVSESLELFRSTAFKIFSLCESLSSLLTASIEYQSCYVFFQQVTEAFMQLTGSMVDEIDLITYWAYSNISPSLVPSHVSPSFRFASSCLPGRMMARTIWRNDRWKGGGVCLISLTGAAKSIKMAPLISARLIKFELILPFPKESRGLDITLQLLVYAFGTCNKEGTRKKRWIEMAKPTILIKQSKSTGYRGQEFAQYSRNQFPMGFCRLIRTTLWRRMLILSSEVRYRRSSAFQPLIHSEAIKKSSAVRSKRMSRTYEFLRTAYRDERQHAISPGVKASLKLIDVALVAGGENAARQVPVLVKSIFYHRLFSQNCRQPRPNFRFHIICSSNTCKGLSVLFDTWKVAGLIKVHFYDIAKYETIVLDLDTLVEGNLINLWNAAGRFESDEFTIPKDGLNQIFKASNDITIIGLVENQSEWYLSEREKSLWPALGHGFNTGVMLIDLKKMRKMGWNQYWKNVTQMHLKNASYTALADQTGLGLDTETQKESNKMKHESMTPASFRLQFALKMEHLSNLDGNLFKRNTTLWDKFKTTSYESGIMKFCSLLRLELKVKRRIFPFFFGSNANITGDVSLVSQLTLDRLHRLEEIAAHWEGPMSLAVYITDREAGILAEYLESSPFLISRNNIYIHLVFQEGVSFGSVNTIKEVPRIFKRIQEPPQALPLIIRID
ncbi:hypothetical protein ACTXT7_011660 [Hymenolepis weldensis]